MNKLLHIALKTAVVTLLAWPWLLTAAPAGQKPAPPQQKPVLSDAQVAKLREYSLVVADKLLAYNDKEMAHIKSRKKPFPGDAESLKKLQMSTDYVRAYKDRLAAKQEMVAYQEECRKKKITGKEAVDKLIGLDKTFQEASKKMGELAKAYKATFQLEIPDPYRIVVEKVFPPEPLKK